MNISNLHYLLEVIPEMIELFLPGFLFMCVYTLLFNKKYDISIIVLWSLFITHIIVVFYSAVHQIILADYTFPTASKEFISAITGAAMPCLLYMLNCTKVYKNFFLKVAGKTTHKDIFDDAIDYNKRTIVHVYLKNSNIMYAGIFALKGEEHTRQYICLVDYVVIDKATMNVLKEMEEETSAIIDLSDAERVELIYEADSDVWKGLSVKNDSKVIKK